MLKGFDAFSVTRSDSIVRITKCAGPCEGIVRLGLTTNDLDNHEFTNGYWIGLNPHVTSDRLSPSSYVVPSSTSEPLTLAIEEGVVVVYKAGQKVHQMGRTRQKGMHAKVFVHACGDAVEVGAFEEYPDDDSKWDAAFKLPRAVERLKKRTPKRSTSSTSSCLSTSEISNDSSPYPCCDQSPMEFRRCISDESPCPYLNKK